MTCIAGAVHGKKVYIGGDSAGVADHEVTIRADAKVFRNGDYLLGFTSSFRMGQLLRYAFTPPTPKKDQDAYGFLVTDFVNAVRECLKSGGYATKSNEQESGGTFLVGFRGRLFSIHGDYQVAESADGYDAVGCGDAHAKGALHALRNRDGPKRVQAALEAAERHSTGVRGPFLVLSV